MTFGKRQLVIAALVVALGAAVYLNWQFSGVQPVTVTDTESETAKQLGQTTYVNTEISSSSNISETTSENSSVEANTSATVSSLSREQQEYFANERINRSQSQEKAIESLSDIIESASSSETAKQDAVKSAEKLALAIKAESNIESEIKTKGFDDCLVSINNDSCSVIVPKGKLDDAAAISIKDIVVRHGGIDYDKITISEI
ncbi:MAG: SpoIIIAH-like family protein [Acutalibacteraceae bacterium]